MKKQVKSFVNTTELKVSSPEGNIGERVAIIKGIATFEKEDRDGEIVSVEGAEIDYIGDSIPYMRDHNHANATDSTVGKVTEMKVLSDKITFTAEIHEKADPIFFYKVEKGLIKSSSIGFWASEYDIEEVNGKSVGVLKGIKIFELSATPLASNTSATFVVHSTKGISIKQPVEVLKEANPNCSGFDCKLKSAEKPKGKIKDLTQNKIIEKEVAKQIKEDISKAMTITEADNESWNVWQLIEMEMGKLYSVLDDNFWSEKWGDLDRPTMLTNIKEAYETVISRIETLVTTEMDQKKDGHKEDEEQTKSAEFAETKEMEKKEMVTKDGTEAVVEQPTETKQEVAETNTTEESTPSQSQEADEATDSGSVESKQETVVDEKTETKEEPKQEVAEEPKVVTEPVKAEVTLGTVIDTYNNLDLSSLSREEVVTLYETIDLQRQKLENTDVFIQLVEERVQAKLQENN